MTIKRKFPPSFQRRHGYHAFTHLAENRLSSDFCDWSEVTDGLLWETWSRS